MLSTSKYLVIGASQEEYLIDGETIKSGFIQVMNLEQTNDGVIKGYQPMRINLKNSALRIEDFSDAPGIYEIERRRTPKKKLGERGYNLIPIRANLLKKIKFPEREEILLIGAKMIKMEQWKGLVTYLIDPMGEMESLSEKGKAYGYLAIEETFEHWNFNNLQFIPGWYEAEFKSVRDTKGQEMERIADMNPIEQLNMADLAA
jgi:hypothetical protein